jgi:hypothetical protein
MPLKKDFLEIFKERVISRIISAPLLGAGAGGFKRNRCCGSDKGFVDSAPGTPLNICLASRCFQSLAW